MSVHVTSWVWKHSKASTTDKLVLLALADSAHDNGSCWPGIKTISEMCGCSVRTIQYSINRLVQIGELKVLHRYAQNGDQTSNYYQIKCNPTPVQDLHHPGAMDCTTPVQPVAPKPLLEPSSSRKKKIGFSLDDAKALELPASLRTQEFLDAWNNLWLPHRFSHHSGKPSQLTIEQTIKHCQKWGPSKSARLIEQAVAGGWQAIHDNEQKFNSLDSKYYDVETFKPGSSFRGRYS